MTKEKLLNIILAEGFETWGEMYKAVKSDNYIEIARLLDYSNAYIKIEQHIINYLRLQKIKQFTV